MNKSVIRFIAGVLVVLSISALHGCLDSGEPFDPLEQLEKDQLAIDDYIDTQGYTDVQTDTVVNELRYVFLNEGNGDFATGNNWVYMNYKGSLLNGSIFDERDSIYGRLGNFIPGWQILLPYCREGGRMIMFIPSLYAYQNVATGVIPANSPLVFDVTVHEVLSQFEYEQRGINLYADQFIEEYEDGDLVLETDSVEGLHYIIIEEGNGTYPELTDVLNVDYEGRLINDDLFTQAAGAQVILEDLIEGWQLLVPYVSEGGTIMMFIPSEFGYGSQNTNNIPSNSSLIFRVTLNSVQ